MKTLNTKLIGLLVLMALTGVGCGQGSQFQSNNNNVIPPSVTNDGTIPVSPDGNGTTATPIGSKTVAFEPVSIAEFSSYVGLHPLNAPKDFTLTVDLSEVENGRYGGNVKISYIDSGVSYNGNFDAGSGTNADLPGLKDKGLLEAEYNRWFIIDGKYYFSAFFQDPYGAIVLVFDNYVNQGDAQGSGLISGRVYYKNFAQSYAQQSPYRKCWYIYAGPFNCRADAVMNKSSVYPGDGYRLLGKFSGLSKVDAFNE